MKTLSRLLNAIYEFLVEGADDDGLKEFDERLEAAPGTPPKSKGSKALMGLMMGGGARPAGGPR